MTYFASSEIKVSLWLFLSRIRQISSSNTIYTLLLPPFQKFLINNLDIVTIQLHLVQIKFVANKTECLLVLDVGFLEEG